MDALTRRQFDRAMFAKERTLAIRVGEYASRDIKEASFEYGYIKGDTYKPGGTCAGSGKITFTSIITTFNKLDTLHPEIGLLVGDTYQWVKMGEY
ncbi:pblB, partial [Streptococcus pneumoniae]|nr:pblB [Streptococcus pneumoniae]